MRDYLKRRLITLIPIIWGVITLVFFLIHLIPGDPVLMMLGDRATPEQVQALRQSLGLNQPVWKQYLLFWKHLLAGDLGASIYNHVPVTQSITSRFPNTAILATVSLVLSIIWGIPLGILAAYKKNRLPDHISRLLSILGVSMPVFWLGPLLMILFSIKLGWLPVTGGTSPRYLILPAVTLSFGLMTITMRITRASMIDVLNKDYIRLARAKGLSEMTILWRHALKNALLPVVTVIGYQLGALLTGTVIVEYVFSYPGIGRLLIFSILRRDYPTVQGLVLFIALIYVTVNFIIDILYKWIDVRIKF
ncbi:MAG: ABC transporter permease [Calditrichia bacterium]